LRYGTIKTLWGLCPGKETTMDKNDFLNSIPFEEDPHRNEKPDVVELFHLDGTPAEEQ
jgi:hypothetical protein